MLIAIDAHMVGERETGNETYTLNLIKGLLRASGRDPKGFSWDHESLPDGESGELRRAEPRRWGAVPRFQLLATHPERLRAALAGSSAYGSGDLPANASIQRLRPANALLRIPLGLPWLAFRQHLDLLHVTYNAPPLSPCPTVVTIHDISFEHYPEFFSPRDLLILKSLAPLSARRSARVITVSQHARREIVERYGLPPEKIAVTYEAAGEQFRPVEDRAALQAVRRKYGIGNGPFVLALGNLQPRKNIGRLVRAFAAVNSNQSHLRLRAVQVSVISDQSSGASDPAAPTTDYRSRITDHGSRITGHCKLVVAGKAQWRESEIYQAVVAVGLQERVVFPGYVDDADLPALYSAASVFVYPSLYEGFGLPPLEAMACATPVICSNAASLPEVSGDAALSVSPTDGEALAQALADVLSSPGLQADLAQRGLRRAGQFSWDRCAAETLAVYREAMESA